MDKHQKPEPLYAAPVRKRCPVCGEISYSSAGIHPQCAVDQCDAERMKSVTIGRVQSPETERMSTFHVWIRPVGEACRVRVDGKENCKWLFARLIDMVGFEECRDLTCSPDGQYTFNVLFGADLTTLSLTKLLRGLPQVELMSQPE